MTDTRDFLAAALKGPVPSWRGEDHAWEQAFWKQGAYHGVLPLIGERVRLEGAPGWPQGVLDRLSAFVRGEAAAELARKAEIMRVLGALTARGIQPLILKGGALAHVIYPAPYLRPREDTDLLMPERSQESVRETLKSLGYAGRSQIAGSLTATQASFYRTDTHGIRHALDVHWRSSNSVLLVSVLDYASARERAVPIAALGPDALGLQAVDALLFACTHRAGHLQFHFNGERIGNCLIWLYDIHLLAGAFSDTDWRNFTSLAARHRVAALCRDGLLAAQGALGTPVPQGVLDEHGAAQSEPSSVLLHGSAVAVMWQEFRILPTWGKRLVLLREHLLPDPRYILGKYGRQSRWWLPWLYLRRAVEGVVKGVGRSRPAR